MRHCPLDLLRGALSSAARQLPAARRSMHSRREREAGQRRNDERAVLLKERSQGNHVVDCIAQLTLCSAHMRRHQQCTLWSHSTRSGARTRLEIAVRRDEDSSALLRTHGRITLPPIDTVISPSQPVDRSTLGNARAMRSMMSLTIRTVPNGPTVPRRIGVWHGVDISMVGLQCL